MENSKAPKKKRRASGSAPVAVKRDTAWWDEQPQAPTSAGSSLLKAVRIIPWWVYGIGLLIFLSGVIFVAITRAGRDPARVAQASESDSRGERPSSNRRSPPPAGGSGAVTAISSSADPKRLAEERSDGHMRQIVLSAFKLGDRSGLLDFETPQENWLFDDWRRTARQLGNLLSRQLVLELVKKKDHTWRVYRFSLDGGVSFMGLLTLRKTRDGWVIGKVEKPLF